MCENRGTMLPCPFCGGRPEVVRDGTNRQSCIVRCEDCGAQVESNERGRGEAWNRRASPPALACPNCEAMRKALEHERGEWEKSATAESDAVSDVLRLRRALERVRAWNDEPHGIGPALSKIVDDALDHANANGVHEPDCEASCVECGSCAPPAPVEAPATGSGQGRTSPLCPDCADGPANGGECRTHDLDRHHDYDFAHCKQFKSRAEAGEAEVERTARLITDEEDRQQFLASDPEYDMDCFKSVWPKMSERDRNVMRATARAVLAEVRR
jgi:Lar family restriction alleviation protein